MQALKRVSSLMALVMVNALLLISPVQAASSCHTINAKGVGQDLGGGKTEATINEGGLLDGTTVGNFTIIGVSGTVASFEGTVTFTTNKGTLTVAIVGTLEAATGAFGASGQVSDATGKLAGATGTLTLTGVENLATGRFTEDVTGSFCVDLAP
jgi:hypothetical protein